MKIGNCIYAKTHAEFLNKVLGKEYKAWMKSSYNLSDGKIIWMIQLGDFISSTGWKNKLETPEKISEMHFGVVFDYKHNTYKNALETGTYFNSADRVVFDVIKTSPTRKYVFRGVFRLNRQTSTSNENVWDLVKDEYEIR